MGAYFHDEIVALPFEREPDAEDTNSAKVVILHQYNLAILLKTEMKALEVNGTWDIVDLPYGKWVVGSKWVYKIKYNVDGTIEQFKAHLVAKGYTQTYGVDYNETFSAVAKMVTVGTVLALVAALEWPLLQMDVYNAFL